MRAALISATVANSIRSVRAMFAKPGDDDKAYGLDDFLLFKEPANDDDTVDVDDGEYAGAHIEAETLQFLFAKARVTQKQMEAKEAEANGH